jgi:hypothetical protein
MGDPRLWRRPGRSMFRHAGTARADCRHGRDHASPGRCRPGGAADRCRPAGGDFRRASAIRAIRMPSRFPWTVLINPVLTPLSAAIEEGWEGCLSVPGLRGWVPRWRSLRYTGFDAVGKPIDRTVAVSTRAWCSTNATTSTAFSIRCGSGTSAASVSSTSFFPERWCRCGRVACCRGSAVSDGRCKRRHGPAAVARSRRIIDLWRGQQP